MRYRYLLFILIAIIYTSCGENTQKKEKRLDEKTEQNIHRLAKSYFTPLPKIEWDKMTAERKKMIEIGKKLFYDKRLSGDQNVNCASCHDIAKYGVDNLPVSPGDKNQFGTRNTPTVLNAYLQYAQFWDAHARTVEEQCVGPIFGNFEMDMPDTTTLISRLEKDAYYSKAFAEAFPQADTSITIETIKRAIGAFERTLVTPGPFDKYLKGDLSAISTKAKMGIKSFADNGCIPCHSTSLVGGEMAQKFALYGYYWDYTNSNHIDKGRYIRTGDTGDKFVFKVPTLRNVAKTFPYFHDGSVEKLEDAIKIMGMAETNIQMKQEDVDNIHAFLNSLTGELPKHAFEKEPLPY